MMQHQLHRNPWYRGYMPRSYIAPHKLASYGCSIYLIVFGIFFLFAGTIFSVVSNVVKQHEDDPAFQSDFFKKARENRPNFPLILRTIGIVVLCLAGVFILSAVGLCCFAKFHMDKRGNKQQNAAAMPLNQEGSTFPPPPPGSYPQQQPPPPGSYPQQQPPPPGSYPQQQPPPPGSYQQQQPPPSGYPQQYTPVGGSYPSQPVITGYLQQTAPPSGYPSPTQQPPPSDLYVNEKNAPYPESQGPATATAPSVGFKEG